MHEAWATVFNLYRPETRRIVNDGPDDTNYMFATTLARAVCNQQWLEYYAGYAAYVVPPQVREWEPVSMERFNEMLGMLPPATMTGYGFLVGEPMDHHPIFGFARYAAFVQIGHDGPCYECTTNMGVKEFRNLDIAKMVSAFASDRVS